MKRTTTFLTLITAAAVAIAGCTVKDIDQAPLAGPSTLAHSIRMSATTDTLTQNGVDFTEITISSLGPTGQSEPLPLRAQIVVDGIAMDFGTLSTKTPTAPTTIRYTAPAASPIAVQAPTTVSIQVTPSSLGDFRAEQARSIDIRVLPQGVILPTNPELVPAFTFAPAAPQAFQTVTFDASATSNRAAACGSNCSYAWNFGDGSTGTGVTVNHIFRAPGTVPVTLVVTDNRGAQASTSQAVSVGNVAQPTGTFTLSPATNLSTNTDILFNASSVTWAGRSITNYSWSFGDGSTGSGVTTSHRYTGAGSYTVTLTLTDSLGAQGQVSQTVTVTTLGGLTAVIRASTTAPRIGQRVVFDATGSTPSAGSYIVSYRFIYGDGGDEIGDSPIQSHVYTSSGTFAATVVVTDNNGKVSSASITLTVP